MPKIRCLLVCLFLMLTATSFAQSTDAVVLQLAMHESMTTSLRMRSAIAEFEELNDGVHVQLLAYNQFLDRQSAGVDLDLWRTYLRQGDVVYVETGWFDAELTRTGYLLDLDPIYSTDTLSQEAVIAGDSFVWDGGRWGLPVGVHPVVLYYDTEIFDSLGLSYPDEDWTFSDLENWLNVLGTDKPSILINQNIFPTVMRQLLGTTLYDPITNPIVPDFHIDDIQATITTLQQLMTSDAIEIDQIYINDELPPLVFSKLGLGVQTASYDSVAFGLSANGLSVSNGTAYPELSYQLARFLAQNANVVSNFGGWAAYEMPDDVTVSTYLGELPAEMTTGIHYPETFFTPYLQAIIEGVSEPTLEDLQNAELRAQENLINAQDRISDRLSVNEPELRPNVSGDVLRFGVFTNISPLPTRTIWETVAREYVESSPDIADIIIEPVFGGDGNLQASEQFDCFYRPTNAVSSSNLTNILPLTPLIDVDPDLDRDDFVGGTLAQVSHDNQIWAFPMDIKPFAMWISDDFVEASALDINNMSLETFFALQATHTEDTPMMIPYDGGGTHLLLLIYALDGLPFDYRVDPPIINFTAQETIDAINTVISLIDNGILDYVSPLTSMGSSGIAPIIIAPMDDTNTRQGNLVFMSSGASLPSSAYNPYAFPYGRNITPISYELGTAYISAYTMLPEQCYRFLSSVSQEPYLFTSMSARLSTIERVSQDSVRSSETVDFYQSFAELAGRDDTLFIPSANRSEDFYLRLIFYHALDRIIAEDVVPEDMLFQAEQVAQEFEACLASGDSSIEFFRQCLDPVIVFLEA